MARTHRLRRAVVLRRYLARRALGSWLAKNRGGDRQGMEGALGSGLPAMGQRCNWVSVLLGTTLRRDDPTPARQRRVPGGQCGHREI